MTIPTDFDATKDLRVDLWEEMSMQQLNAQRDLVTDRMSKLFDIINMSQATRQLYATYEAGYARLLAIIDGRFKQLK